MKKIKTNLSLQTKILCFTIVLFVVFCSTSNILWYESLTDQAVHTAVSNVQSMMEIANTSFEKTLQDINNITTLICLQLQFIYDTIYSNISTNKIKGGINMTELETMQRAKTYLDKLAQGIDPITNQEIPEDSTLNNLRLARCFFYVSDVLEQVIANGGVIGGKSKLQAFSITMEQLAKVQISQEPIRVTQLVDRISAAADNTQMKKLRTTVITDWLVEKGFLEKQLGADGKSIRIPTRNGLMIGLSAQTRQGQYGEYQAVFYNVEAQRFILDNFADILQAQK